MTRNFFRGFSGGWVWMAAAAPEAAQKKNAKGRMEYKKLGAFYVEFIFHARLARDFFSSPSPFARGLLAGRVGVRHFFGEFCSGFCPKLLFLSWTFFSKIRSEEQKHIEIFLLPKCPPSQRQRFVSLL